MRPAVQLFHFSDEPGITKFVPRPVRSPVERRTGYDWLNGPLVWAIDAWHQPLYLFPRECPRILIWSTDKTTMKDRDRWLGEGDARMVAFVEEESIGPLSSAVVHRYELPSDTFEDIGDAGMWVSREPAIPLGVEMLSNLPVELSSQDVELRAVPSLLPLKCLWQSTLHASGIRLRNAAGWGELGWPRTSAS